MQMVASPSTAGRIKKIGEPMRVLNERYGL